MKTNGCKLPQAVLRELAVAASCDPRTIAKALNGELTGRYEAHERAKRVLRERGYLPSEAEDES